VVEKVRRKPATKRKEASIRFRVTAKQKRELEKAAEKEGLTLSSWILSTVLAKAREEAHE
jgi:uncharacterized protein (DUF1778 family)